MAQRFVDHAVEARLPPSEVDVIAQELGYSDLEDFCRDVGLPHHIVERWKRFGVSFEMGQVFSFLVRQRKRVQDAVAEFESTRHVGLDDFFEERSLI